jgi:hypothetical protein
MRYPPSMNRTRAIGPLLAILLAGCGPSRSEGSIAPPPRPPASGAVEDRWLDAPTATAPATADTTAAPAPPADRDAAGKDFIEEAKILYRVAACAGSAPIPPNLDARVVKAHCDELSPKIEGYRKRYVGVARPFLSALLPPNLPAAVVYPFGGGDLVTALTTYPEAREYTTLSLELAGDPRRVRTMSADALKLSLEKLRRELSELILVDDYSRSETLKKTQRGDIPGELAFFLVALAVHGFEPVSLRYFDLRADGSIHYLSQEDIDRVENTRATHRKGTWAPPDFSEAFANAEIAFRRAGAAPDEPVRVHRHFAENLADDHFGADLPLKKHLEAKGRIAAMTKAASYLLWKDPFSQIRDYLLGHMDFMISDSTGIPPAFAAPLGFAQETYGSFKGSLLRTSGPHNAAFRKLWDGQPRRKLPFRFGYLDSAKNVHLLVTRRPSPPPTAPPSPGDADAGAPDAGAPEAGAADQSK